jgi:hypothetical protein
MLNLFLQSGALNMTFWAGLMAFFGAVVAWIRTPVRSVPADGPRRYLALFSSMPFLVFVAAGTLFNVSFALYKDYVIPRDVMQDIVSAQQWLEGKSLYPDDMSERMQAALAREEPRSLVWWSPSLHEREMQERRGALTLHWVQAHPPFMTLCFAPLVAAGGVYGAIFCVTALSLAALLLTLSLLQRGLSLRLSWRQTWLLVLAVFGWAPVVAVLRSGQSGLLLGLLLVVGWLALHKNRPVLAGAAIGLAVCLKLYPGLLLVYLLLRQRRAFASALATIGVLTVFTAVLCGWDAYREHFATTAGVVEEYAAYPNNLSLLGLLARSFPANPGGLLVARGVALGVSLIVLGCLSGLALLPTKAQENGPTLLNLDYSLFVCLIPLLSPVAWDHYLVILLLPLAVLGTRALLPLASWRAVLGVLGLVVVFAVPDTTFTWLAKLLAETIGRLGSNFLLLSVRSVAVAALGAWLAVLALQHKKWGLSLPPLKVAPPIPVGHSSP